MTIVGFGNGMTIPNATSGMLSVRPHLAGTASGLGGATCAARFAKRTKRECKIAKRRAMAVQKIYAGSKLRELRGKVALTQKEFAAKLGVSLPYLNQMENNKRPLSTTVVLALAQEFGFDVTELSSGDAERLVTDMREALADPVLDAILARAFLELHRAYRQTHERLASLDEALGRDDGQLQPSPWEDVRDFFHYCDNYIDAMDRAAEHFAASGPKGASIKLE